MNTRYNPADTALLAGLIIVGAVVIFMLAMVVIAVAVVGI